MSTLNYIDENGNINKAGVIPKNYPASNIKMANGESVEDAMIKYTEVTYTIEALPAGGYKKLGAIPYQSCIGCVAKDAINIDGTFSVSITNGDVYINVVKAQSGTGTLTVSFLYT